MSDEYGGWVRKGTFLKRLDRVRLNQLTLSFQLISIASLIIPPSPYKAPKMHMWILLLSVAGVAGVALLFFIASKTAKSKEAWQKLDDADTASVDPSQNVGGRRAKRNSSWRRKHPTVAGEPKLETGLKQKRPHTAWEDSSYYWVVVCKNHWVHRRPNIFHVHRIPLGETDAVTPRPIIDRPILVRCDLCHKEYAYKLSEVLRYEQENPESFTPHPLFREEN